MYMCEAERGGGVCWLFQAAHEVRLIANTWGLGTLRAALLKGRTLFFFSLYLLLHGFFYLLYIFQLLFLSSSSYKACLSTTSPRRHILTFVSAYSWKQLHGKRDNHTASCTQHIFISMFVFGNYLHLDLISWDKWCNANVLFTLDLFCFATLGPSSKKCSSLASLQWELYYLRFWFILGLSQPIGVV